MIKSKFPHWMRSLNIKSSMNTNLQFVLQLVNDLLADFAKSGDFWTDFELVFGTQYNKTLANSIKASLANKTFNLPNIAVVSNTVLGSAFGAYASSNDTIYLSEAVVNAGNTQQLVAVLLEEIGHAIDSQINTRIIRTCIFPRQFFFLGFCIRNLNFLN